MQPGQHNFEYDARSSGLSGHGAGNTLGEQESHLNYDNIDAMKDPAEIIQNIFDKETMLEKLGQQDFSPNMNRNVASTISAKKKTNESKDELVQRLLQER